ncbi:MAG: hypothetical protein KA236_07390 [Verrucomicrobia bacterium]|jgi:hypothetical protein|nr:hypothetical protein [Verrucomicrobiota bacterium]
MKRHQKIRWKKSLLFTCAGLAGALAAGAALPDPLWSIGTSNGAAMEFAPGGRDRLEFKVGESVVSRDFAGSHTGSVGWDGRVKERPYLIYFDLPEPPEGHYELVLDLLFSTGAPAQFKIMVNEQLGLFPLRPVPRPSTWGEEGNDMLLAKQQLVVPIAAAWLKPKGNRISLIPLGLGSLSYDALCLRRTAAVPDAPPQLAPSIFFHQRGDQLVEVCDLLVPFTRRFDRATAAVTLGGQTFNATLTNALYDFGVWVEPLEIPAARVTGSADITVTLANQTLRHTHPVKPAKQWKVFICPKVHNDVGYTDLQPHVNELDNRNTDAVLEILRQHPAYKFNFETSWLVENYLDCRTPPWRQLFFDYARRERIGINVFYLNLMTGICTGEELHRALYLTHRYHRTEGSDFAFGCLTDAPSHSWFLPTLFSDVGVKAFANGANQTRAPILHFSELNEDSPYWWEGMNGERIFMWYSRSYVQLKRLTGPVWGGDVSSFEYLQRSVPQFLIRYQREQYAPDAVMIYGAYVDNAAIPAHGDAPALETWNETFAFPKLIVATDADYFNYVEQHFADRLPVYRGDCGAYWEDGVGSTMHATMQNRQTQQILPAAETAATLATLFEPRNRYPAEDFYGAWRNVMFYNEHTWGAHNSISQPGRQFVERQWEIKESYATRANLDARSLLARGCNRLAQQIAVDGSSILAFNWQNRARTAPLEVELNTGDQLVDFVDQQPVPMDVYAEQDGWRKVRFVAHDVPAMGFKAYGIRRYDPAAHRANETLDGDTLENEFYRLTVDPRTGGLKSLYDKTAQRELLDAAAPYALNEYLYVSGGEGSLILNFTFGTPPANLTIHRPEAATITQVSRTPLGQRLIVETRSKNTPKIISEYRLYDGLKRVEIVNTVEKEEVRAKEAVYFAFPFAAAEPAMEYQIQNGWVRPNADQMPGACREWFTPQNVVHVRDGNFSIAWATPDVPLVTLTDINRGLWLDHLPLRNGHVYSYAMNNYWFTNYRAQQGGRFVFRYFITSGRDLGREDLARFDQDTRTPVLAYPFLSSFSAAISQLDRPLPASGASFLAWDAPNLEMVTLKTAEDGDGFILRLREIAGRRGEAEIKLPTFRVREAHLCNGVEVKQRNLATSETGFVMPYQPNAFMTVRFQAEARLPSPAGE